MALGVELVDPLRDARWGELLTSSHAAGPFHHPLWLRLLHTQYGYGLGAVCVTEADGRLAAGLPFARIHSRLTGPRLVALPFSDLCAPVVSRTASEPGLEALVGAIEEEQ